MSLEYREFTLSLLGFLISGLVTIALGTVVSKKVAVVAALLLLGVQFQLQTGTTHLRWSETIAAIGRSVPDECAEPAYVNWSVSEAPKGTAQIAIDQPACTTLLVTSGMIRATSGWSCGNEARQQCAYANRTGTRPQRIDLFVDVGHVWYGITSASVDRALADKSVALLAPPNCGTGCAWATVGRHDEGRLQGEQRVSRPASGPPSPPAASR